MAKLYSRAPQPKIYKMREYSDGIRIAGGITMKPAPYLPILSYDNALEKGIVIEKGTFVTFDPWGYVVPAFVGSKTLTYGALDVQEGVFDIDSFTGSKNDPVVSQAKTSTLTIGTDDGVDVKIGKPVGVLMYDAYAWDMNKDPWYQVQPGITILADRMILLALDSAHENLGYEPGDMLVLDENGYPVPFSVDATDASTVAASVENLKYGIGRLVRVIDVNSTIDKDFLAGLDKVINPPIVSGLPGSENGGAWDGIDATTKKGLLIQLWF